ncbi:hypothetical protein RchiOBHm_Chr5g0038521 [Rosa chinensis]|uniref:Uncharacterized protein n=1 Tax=Rosa chinensis TaxID=74649 RepID=A0A2P6QC04_ROSCH|nr:hypothetical protein RchiOBHm_Chr5g0038521 [Rosa chinensis]
MSNSPSFLIKFIKCTLQGPNHNLHQCSIKLVELQNKNKAQNLY